MKTKKIKPFYGFGFYRNGKALSVFDVIKEDKFLEEEKVPTVTIPTFDYKAMLKELRKLRRFSDNYDELYESHLESIALKRKWPKPSI